jgi:anti-sigma factor RsiW
MKQMASLLQQLENNEAILLMYLADELGADDRREVEQMLAGDATLAAELERIRAAQDAVMSAIGAMDQSAPLRVSTPVATRQISRLMKQWQVDRLTLHPVVVAKKGSRIPWWGYPAASAAAAAVMLIGLMVWWGMKSDLPPVAEDQNNATAQVDDDSKGLADAEQQASQLVQRSDDVAVTDSIFMTESVK